MIRAVIAVFAGLALFQLCASSDAAESATVNVSATSHAPAYSNLPTFPGTTGLAVVFHDAPAAWKASHTRAECLVQVRLSSRGGGITDEQWFRINLRSMIYWVYGAPRIGVAAYQFWQESSSIFLLFYENCSQRFVHTQSFFAQMKASIIRFPNYKVLHDDVSSSARTLNVCGHWWKDGERGMCNENLSPPPQSRSCGDESQTGRPQAGASQGVNQWGQTRLILPLNTTIRRGG